MTRGERAILDVVGWYHVRWHRPCLLGYRELAALKRVSLSAEYCRRALQRLERLGLVRRARRGPVAWTALTWMVPVDFEARAQVAPRGSSQRGAQRRDRAADHPAFDGVSLWHPSPLAPAVAPVCNRHYADLGGGPNPSELHENGDHKQAVPCPLTPFKRSSQDPFSEPDGSFGKNHAKTPDADPSGAGLADARPAAAPRGGKGPALIAPEFMLGAADAAREDRSSAGHGPAARADFSAAPGGPRPDASAATSHGASPPLAGSEADARPAPATPRRHAAPERRGDAMGPNAEASSATREGGSPSLAYPDAAPRLAQDGRSGSGWYLGPSDEGDASRGRLGRSTPPSSVGWGRIPTDGVRLVPDAGALAAFEREILAMGERGRRAAG